MARAAAGTRTATAPPPASSARGTALRPCRSARAASDSPGGPPLLDALDKRWRAGLGLGRRIADRHEERAGLGFPVGDQARDVRGVARQLARVVQRLRQLRRHPDEADLYRLLCLEPEARPEFLGHRA